VISRILSSHSTVELTGTQYHVGLDLIRLYAFPTFNHLSNLHYYAIDDNDYNPSTDALIVFDHVDGTQFLKTYRPIQMYLARDRFKLDLFMSKSPCLWSPVQASLLIFAIHFHPFTQVYPENTCELELP
jgi:hypothetical protein